MSSRPNMPPPPHQHRRMSDSPVTSPPICSAPPTVPPHLPSYLSRRMFGKWISPNDNVRSRTHHSAHLARTYSMPSFPHASSPSPSRHRATHSPHPSPSTASPSRHVKIDMENDSESQPLAPALSRYLNAMNKNEEDGQPYQEPAGLDLEPGQASSATHNQAPKVRYVNEHIKGPCSFFHVLFLGRGGMGFVWFIMKILPQLVLGIALCLVVEFFGGPIHEDGWWASREETQKLHNFVGVILAFVLGLRSNGCYDRYYEARKTLGLIVNNIREIVLESCSMFIKQDGGNGGDQNQNQDQHAHVQIYRNEIRRKLNIMLAFIRQNVRESHVGFTPGSSEEFTHFHEGDNFVRDPVRPRLCDLLTPAEVVAYREAPVFARAVCVASEIKGVAQLLGEQGTLYFRVSHCLEVCLDAQETLYRIITTPLPFPYVWILEVVLFLFVFSVPFLYDSDAGRYFGTVILVVGYYGTKCIAEQCENPLEWDACDLDVEALTMWIHDETCALSNFTHAQNKSFIPANIRFDATAAVDSHDHKHPMTRQ